MEGKIFQEDICYNFLLHRKGLVFFCISNCLRLIKRIDEKGLVCLLS
jgi:hypothetical protein